MTSADRQRTRANYLDRGLQEAAQRARRAIEARRLMALLVIVWCAVFAALAVALWVLATARSVRADQPADEIVVRGATLTSRLVILVDGSGSMSMQGGAPYRAAVREALSILVETPDDAAFRLAVFHGSGTTWLCVVPDEARECQGTRADGWCYLPSLNAIESAHSFLESHDPGGHTPLAAAVEAALAGVSDEDRASLIVITDGEPDGHDWAIATVIASVQARGVPLLVIRVTESQVCEAAIRAGCETVGGTYVRRAGR